MLILDLHSLNYLSFLSIFLNFQHSGNQYYFSDASSQKSAWVYVTHSVWTVDYPLNHINTAFTLLNFLQRSKQLQIMSLFSFSPMHSNNCFKIFCPKFPIVIRERFSLIWSILLVPELVMIFNFEDTIQLPSEFCFCQWAVHFSLIIIFIYKF